MQTVILDSTQISNFLECPRLWHYADVKRLIASERKFPLAVSPLDIGSYGHKLMEIYYGKRGAGFGIADALEASMAYDPDTEFCTCGGRATQHNLDTYDNIMCTCSEGCECDEFDPIPADLPIEERKSIQERFVQYIYTYSNNDFHPEAVELGFSHKLLETTERLYVLEGKIDILTNHGGLEMFVDHKFQSRRHDLYKKSIQFKDYALASNRIYGMINYVRLAKTIDKDTFKRELISFSRVELDMWRLRLIGIFDTVAAALRGEVSDTLYWMMNNSNPNWSACGGKWGHTCPFTPLCEEVEPQVVKAKIEQLYSIKGEWSPW